MTAHTGTEIPSGFVPLNIPAGKFLAENGPLYGRVEDGHISLGMQIGVPHTNVGGICHGGMSMTFADTQLVIGSMARLDNYAPLMTVNTCVDFVRPGIVGGWFQGETKVIRATRNLVFAESMISIDGELALRASGVLRRTDYDPFKPENLFRDEPSEPAAVKGESNPPEDFRLANIPGPFLAVNGPLHAHLEGNNLRLGLRIEDRHCNTSGWCHGGTMMTFADVQMGVGTMINTGETNFMPTMHMSTDFVVPVRAGAWLVGETDVTRMTRNMAFSTCILSVDGEPVARSSSVNKRTTAGIKVVTPASIFDFSESA